MELNILIVDDDKNLLSTMKAILTGEGQSNIVTLCNDGQKAIQLCRNKKYDLIITDLMMPGANGLEVLKESRKIDPETLVVLVTGFASLETAVQAIREGAYDYITKPFKLDEIRIVVNNAREKIQLIRENRNLIEELQQAYEQLNMMKKLMGVGVDEIDREHEKKEKENELRPVIAGSMLPFYYSDKIKKDHSPILSDLERIAMLREKGLLTEEEFSLCKSKLLMDIKT
jgi:DNA-binding response OmpR family regulator